MNERSIRSIAIAGGGIVGLSAALAFTKSLPLTKVTVIGTPTDPAALADQMPAAWPTSARFHAFIGLNEMDLIRSGVAAHHLGTVVENWSGGGASWVHAFAPHGKPVGGIPFDQVWAQARTGPYDSYSVGAALARAGKFVHPSGGPNALSSRFQYGLRLDPDLYRARLAAAAATANVDVFPGVIGKVERREDGGIAALALDDGRMIEADLFIDCAGPAGLLIGSVDDGFEDWPTHLGRGIDIGAGEPTSAARIRAAEDGWAGEWPLRDRTISCAIRSEGAIALRPGRRPRPWARNVLALGDAAVAFDPLHGLNLDLVQRFILLALELLPGRDFNPVELSEYNRRAGLMSDQVRDFIGLHYWMSGRCSDFWISEREPPEILARIVDQYSHRGRLPFQEEETLTRDDWTAALLGLGIYPEQVDPAASGVPLDQAVPAMERLGAEIEGLVSRAPSYVDYLNRMSA